MAKGNHVSKCWIKTVRLLAAGLKCRICVYPGPLSPGIGGIPFLQECPAHYSVLTLRLLAGGAGSAPGRQVMSLHAPSMQVFSAFPHWGTEGSQCPHSSASLVGQQAWMMLDSTSCHVSLSILMIPFASGRQVPDNTCYSKEGHFKVIVSIFRHA